MRASLARLLLRLAGWRVRYEGPAHRRYVLIGWPHTSNWDFPVAILALWAMEIPGRWVGKHTLFRGPAGPLMRALGGIPLDREATTDFVSQVVGWYREREELVVVISPEGTRSRTNRWRTGFYYIARGARVPIALAYMDWGRREVGVGETFLPGEDLETDMERIRAFYAGRRGLRHGNASPIRTRPDRTETPEGPERAGTSGG